MKVITLPNNDIILYTDDGDGVWLTRKKKARKKFDPRAYQERVDADARVLERLWIPRIKAFFDDQADVIAQRVNSRRRRLAKFEVRKTAAELVIAKEQANALAEQMMGEFYDEQAFRDAFADQMNAMFTDVTDTVLTSTSIALGVDFAIDVRESVLTSALSRVNQLTGRVSQSTYRQVKNAIADGITQGMATTDIAKLIRQVMQSASKARAEVIARTEVISAYNGGVYDTGGALPPSIAAGMVWIAASDERTRPTHASADGQIVSMGQPFTVGGEALRFPGDPNGSRKNTIQCRCATSIITPEDMQWAQVNARTVHNVLIKMALHNLSYRDALIELRVGDKPGHPFRGNQWGGQRIGTMTRKQLLATLSSTGYKGPTSYSVDRLRQITDTHLANEIALATGAPTTVLGTPTVAPSAPAPLPAAGSAAPLTAHAIDTLPRTALVAALKANGYTGPTSYNMEKLRSIAHQHAKSPVAVRASTPPPPGVVRGRNLINDKAGVAAIAATPLPDSELNYHGDRRLAVFTKAQGFDGKPEVVSEAEFNARVGTGEFHRFPPQGMSPGGEVLHRGIMDGPDGKLVRDFREGTFYAGNGVYGNGTYTSTSKHVADGYAGVHNGGAQLKMALRSDATVVSYDQLEREYRSYVRSVRMSPAVVDMSHFAVLRGYDAMHVVGSGQPGHVVVYNRTALVVVGG